MAFTYYYVDGENGDNSDNGSTPALAFSTIQYALDKVTDGTIGVDGVIIIMNTAIYDVEDDESKITTGVSKHVILTGANSDGVVDGTQIRIRATGTWNATAGVVESNHTGYTYMNIIFDGNDLAEYGWNRGGSAGDSVAFINCRFTNALGWGCYPNNSYFHFYNCEFDNNGDADTDAHGGCYRVYYGHFYRCVFRDNRGQGLYNPGHRSSIDRCVFSNNSRYGLSLYGECRVSDSIFEENDRGAIYMHGHATYMPGHIINCVFRGNANHSTAIPAIYSASSAYTALVYNNVFDNTGYNGQIGGATAGTVTDRFAYFEAHGGTVGPVYYEGATLDMNFTPISSSKAVGAGIPAPFQVRGTTASADAGHISFANTETISIF